MIEIVKTKSVRKSKDASVDSRSVRKTITLPPDVDAEISKVAGAGKFSAFVLRAVSNELQRERIEAWLAEREAARGGAPLDSESIAFAEAAWRRRK
jgi:post-segregation antitoxin (ccd killing protein)